MFQNAFLTEAVKKTDTFEGLFEPCVKKVDTLGMGILLLQIAPVQCIEQALGNVNLTWRDFSRVRLYCQADSK